VELTDIISHPLTEVVLQLEYVVRWSGVAIMPAGTLAGSSRRGSSIKVRELGWEKREGKGRLEREEKRGRRKGNIGKDKEDQ